VTHINLFPDQSELVNRVRQSMRSNRNVLMQAATGSGKTIMATYMIDQARKKGSRAGFMVPRRELLKQTAQTMDKYGIPYGCVAAGWRPDPFAKVQLMSVGTVARRLDSAPRLNVLFIDEAHFGGDELDRVIRHYQAQGTWLVGLSATPWKLSGKGLGVWYDDMQEGPSIRWLMDNNRLSDYRLFAPSAPDLSGIKTVAGDYAKGELNNIMEHDRVLIGNAAKHYKTHAMGRLNVAYCTSIKHAEITASAFRDAGIPAAHVSGKMDDAEITRRVKAFARREILTLCNADLLTFGFDLSAASGMDVTIESMSDLRPTKSLALQCQKWGRVLRMKNEPALIFDHAGNSAPDLHGLPDSDRDWTLEGRDRRRSDGEKTEPTRQCQECYFVHRPSPTCPNCGNVYPVIGRQIDEVEGELEEVTERGMTPKQEIGMVARTEGLQGLIDYGRAKGYKPGWARKQAQIRGLA
jgi:DNA repair protein RadD